MIKIQKRILKKETKHTKTISRFVWRISERRRWLNSSSVVPSKRFGFVDGVEDFLLLLLLVDCGEVGISERFLLIIDDIGGNNGDDEGDETAFITGEFIAFEDVGVRDDWVSVSTLILFEKYELEKEFSIEKKTLLRSFWFILCITFKWLSEFGKKDFCYFIWT